MLIRQWSFHFADRSRQNIARKALWFKNVYCQLSIWIYSYDTSFSTITAKQWLSHFCFLNDSCHYLISERQNHYIIRRPSPVERKNSNHCLLFASRTTIRIKSKICRYLFPVLLFCYQIFTIELLMNKGQCFLFSAAVCLKPGALRTAILLQRKIV